VPLPTRTRVQFPRPESNWWFGVRGRERSRIKPLHVTPQFFATFRYLIYSAGFNAESLAAALDTLSECMAATSPSMLEMD
jgi:hypothetical protein